MKGKRILVVEDDAVYAMWIADLLADEGADVVGPAGNVKTARELVRRGVDGAVLDIQLGHEFIWPVAIELRRRGVPLVFLSSFQGEIPEELGNAPLVTKLAVPERLLAVCAAAIDPSSVASATVSPMRAVHAA